MGKNSVIKSLGRCIGNVVLHKLLAGHTNKPESRNYLRSEIMEYSSDAFEKAQEFNWNEKDKEEIKNKSIERIKSLIKNYPDLPYNEEEAIRLIKETMNELLL